MSTDKDNKKNSNLPISNVSCSCPYCKSKNISDNSKYKNNGILGPGRRSWKISDERVCNDCGGIFKPTDTNCN